MLFLISEMTRAFFLTSIQWERVLTHSENWALQNLATAEILIFNWYWTDNWDYNALTSTPQITQRETYAGLTPLNLVNLTRWWL